MATPEYIYDIDDSPTEMQKEMSDLIKQMAAQKKATQDFELGLMREGLAKKESRAEADRIYERGRRDKIADRDYAEGRAKADRDYREKYNEGFALQQRIDSLYDFAGKNGVTLEEMDKATKDATGSDEGFDFRNPAHVKASQKLINGLRAATTKAIEDKHKRLKGEAKADAIIDAAAANGIILEEKKGDSSWSEYSNRLVVEARQKGEALDFNDLVKENEDKKKIEGANKGLIDASTGKSLVELTGSDGQPIPVGTVLTSKQLSDQFSLEDLQVLSRRSNYAELSSLRKTADGIGLDAKDWKWSDVGEKNVGDIRNKVMGALTERHAIAMARKQAELELRSQALVMQVPPEVAPKFDLQTLVDRGELDSVLTEQNQKDLKTSEGGTVDNLPGLYEAWATSGKGQQAKFEAKLNALQKKGEEATIAVGMKEVPKEQGVTVIVSQLLDKQEAIAAELSNLRTEDRNFWNSPYSGTHLTYRNWDPSRRSSGAQGAGGFGASIPLSEMENFGEGAEGFVPESGVGADGLPIGPWVEVEEAEGDFGAEGFGEEMIPGQTPAIPGQTPAVIGPNLPPTQAPATQAPTAPNTGAQNTGGVDTSVLPFTRETLEGSHGLPPRNPWNPTNIRVNVDSKTGYTRFPSREAAEAAGSDARTERGTTMRLRDYGAPGTGDATGPVSGPLAVANLLNPWSSGNIVSRVLGDGAGYFGDAPYERQAKEGQAHANVRNITQARMNAMSPLEKKMFLARGDEAVKMAKVLGLPMGPMPKPEDLPGWAKDMRGLYSTFSEKYHAEGLPFSDDWEKAYTNIGDLLEEKAVPGTSRKELIGGISQENLNALKAAFPVQEPSTSAPSTSIPPAHTGVGPSGFGPPGSATAQPQAPGLRAGSGRLVPNLPKSYDTRPAEKGWGDSWMGPGAQGSLPIPGAQGSLPTPAREFPQWGAREMTGEEGYEQEPEGPPGMLPPSYQERPTVSPPPIVVPPTGTISLPKAPDVPTPTNSVPVVPAMPVPSVPSVPMPPDMGRTGRYTWGGEPVHITDDGMGNLLVQVGTFPPQPMTLDDFNTYIKLGSLKPVAAPPVPR